MLTTEQNDFICRVGPGTPTGEAMRLYWWPVLLSDELATPDSVPVLIRLLGQNFVAFRDTNGSVGILDEYCCHRGASLIIGRVEDCGIRCLYHGWKFAVDGQIQDAPNVASGRLLERVRQPAYSVHEEAGLVWTYIGPPNQRPPFRRLIWMDLPTSHRTLSAALSERNYLALVENAIDSSHVTVLHRDSILEAPRFPNGQPLNMPAADSAPPRHEVQDTGFGFYYAAMRDSTGDDGATSTWARVAAVVMPTTTFIPPGFCNMIVPVDDVTTLNFNVNFNSVSEVPPQPPAWETYPSLYGKLPGRLLSTSKLTAENGYLQDRNSMRNGSFAGFPGRLAQEDNAVLSCMGTYPTRSMEHVVPADIGVLKLRRKLADLATRPTRGDSPGRPSADVTGVRDHEGPVDSRNGWRQLISELIETSS